MDRQVVAQQPALTVQPSWKTVKEGFDIIPVAGTFCLERLYPGHISGRPCRDLAALKQ
jgi:hypothetical protein